MTLFFADLVREASWGVGAGDLPLGGALPGHRRFADAVPPGARFHYCIAGVTHPDEWETGEGEIGSADTLIRLPLASSAGDAAVPFSAGLKTVALTVNADWFAAREAGEAVDPAALAEALAAKADLAGAAFAGAVSAPGLSLGAPLAIADGGTGAAEASAARAGLGLGTAATQGIGTSGANVPLLDGANSWGASQSITGRVTATQQLRGTGYATPPAGNGVDVGFSGGKGFIQAFNSSGPAILPLRVIGSQIELDPGGTNVATVSSGGLAVTGAVTAGGIELGYRDLPRVTGGLERGKCLATASGVTIGTGPAAGSAYSIYNNSGSAITITQGSGLTLRLAGTGTTGSRTLAARGFATVWFNSASEAIVSGAGVS